MELNVSHKKRGGRFWASVIILLLCFLFMAISFYRNWQKIPFQNLRFDYRFLLISYLLWFGGFPFLAYVWKANLECIGEKISFMQSMKISAFSFLPKYLPGKIWGILGQAWFTKVESGISGTSGGIGAILGTVLNLLSGLLLSTIIFPFASKQISPQIIYIIVSLIPIFFIIIYPSIFLKIITLLLRILKRPKINLAIKYSQILKLLLLYMISWVIQGISIYFLILSFYRIDYKFIIPLCGIFPVASAIGFIILITPGGLGIREGVLSYFFKFYMPTSIAIAASILIRIWATFGEIITFLFFVKSFKKYLQK